MIYLAKAKKRRSGPDLEKYIRIERRYTTYREACTAEKKQEVFATLNGKIMIK